MVAAERRRRRSRLLLGLIERVCGRIMSYDSMKHGLIAGNYGCTVGNIP